MSKLRVKFVKKGSVKPMSPFKSLEEEANFWNKQTIVSKEFKKQIIKDLQQPKNGALVVRLTKDEKDRLTKIAKSQGLTLSSLARMAILENFYQELQEQKIGFHKKSK